MRSPVFYYAAFFATGVATVSTGALVALHGMAHTPADADVGRLLASQFGGQLIGSYFVGRHVASRLSLGAAVTALAIAVQIILGHLSLPLLFCMGVGLGVAMASVNTLVGIESPPHLRARRLEILNVFWPLGAAFGPWLIVRMPTQHAFTIVFVVIALSFAVIATISARHQHPEATDFRRSNESSSSIPFLVSALALLAVGVESGLANWLPTFQLRYLDFSPLPFPLATLFWSSILLSRLLASRWLRDSSERLVLVSSTLVAGLGGLCLILFHAPWLAALMVFSIAFAIGPVYPLLLTHAIKLPRRGLVFFSASSGSALFPWLIGQLALLSHSLRFALSIQVGGCILLSLLFSAKAFHPTNELAHH